MGSLSELKSLRLVLTRYYGIPASQSREAASVPEFWVSHPLSPSVGFPWGSVPVLLLILTCPGVITPSIHFQDLSVQQQADGTQL